MQPLIEKFYFGSPVWLQNVLVSLYGMKLYRERYAKGASEHLKQLLESEFAPPDVVKRLVDERFRSLAREAIQYVPHYREWAKKQGIKPEDIRGIEDLNLFPVLSKQEIRDNPERFLSEKYSSKEIFKLNTSGTTGTPLTIYTNRVCRTEHYAFFSRLRKSYGLNRKSRRATFFGRIIQLPENQNPPFWRYDRPQRNLLMSSYHLLERNLGAYIRKLNEFAPEEIIGYPSSLYTLAKYIDKAQQTVHSPKVVITTSETLFEHQKEVISKALNAPVVNQYGCTEMAFFASDYPCGKMHIHPEHGWLETTNNSELLATGFVNRVMPLIRYKIGDSGGLNTAIKQCECGRSWPVISELTGRTDDLLIRPDGTPIGRLDPVFKEGQGIKEAQIIQENGFEFVVKIVPDEFWGEIAKEKLIKELRKRLGRNSDIRIVPVKHIPRGANGKFRPVIREV